jgi:hypothetical protein
MNFDQYLEGENPLQDETTSLGKAPQYVLFFMTLIGAGAAAQFGINKIQEVANIGESDTRVDVV